MLTPRIRTYREFWPYYLAQHRNATCRRLHFAGSTGALGLLAGACALHTALLVAAAPVVGYGMAWIGHAFFERNRPATFSYPWWSLRADFEMYLKMWRRRKL